ncbi:MAG: hypothetical protein KKF62_18965 [Bacteroidetes bacterium]|nr:hypothetical protein [Bacteroidota bacterium]MBU1117063.1 hypothetical protein [Bacteroidota bacterium]MBU1797658.1 hypothetical protein [Bacteroidota bacterium]
MGKKLIGFIIIISFMFLQNISGQIIFPRAFAIATDDLGWNNGGSLGDSGGPWRIGIRRKMDIRDYKPIVEVGKTLGVRFQTLFVLSEMDRENVCSKYPTTTMQGEKFDNSANVNDMQLEIMKYVKENAAFMEFGLHGVGHEHWIDGKRDRAEWYDIYGEKPWSEQDSRDHLQCFSEIMAQYGFSKENGQSFPESYVPTAYGYYWNPDGAYSTGKIMHEYGVKYINTLFEEIEELNPPIKFGGGIDHGAIVINRYNYGNSWFELASLPKQTLDEYKTDFIEAHWANWLASDDFLQNDLNKQWIEYFQNIQKSKYHYLAKNTEQLHSQWFYNRYTKISEEQTGVVNIDNTQMLDEVYENELLGNLVLKVSLKEGEHISSAKLNGEDIASYFEEYGYGFIYLPKLLQKEYELHYSVDSHVLPIYVNNKGTYNVYSVKNYGDEIDIELKMYGTQIVQIKTPNPKKVLSENEYLQIISEKYDEVQSILSLELYGRNMQGETGIIKLRLK